MRLQVERIPQAVLSRLDAALASINAELQGVAELNTNLVHLKGQLRCEPCSSCLLGCYQDEDEALDIIVVTSASKSPEAADADALEGASANVSKRDTHRRGMEPLILHSLRVIRTRMKATSVACSTLMFA